MREELRAISAALRGHLQRDATYAPWLHRSAQNQPLRETKPVEKKAKLGSGTAPVRESVVAKPSPAVSTDSPKHVMPQACKAQVSEIQNEFQHLRQIVQRVAPHLKYVETVPTEAQPRCLFLDHGLTQEERTFMERLAQAVDRRLAPARLVAPSQLARLSGPLARLLVTFQREPVPTELSLLLLESPSHYNDKAAKVALWKQLCLTLEK